MSNRKGKSKSITDEEKAEEDRRNALREEVEKRMSRKRTYEDDEAGPSREQNSMPKRSLSEELQLQDGFNLFVSLLKAELDQRGVDTNKLEARFYEMASNVWSGMSQAEKDVFIVMAQDNKPAQRKKDVKRVWKPSSRSSVQRSDSASSEDDVDKKKCKKSESRNVDVDKKKCKKSESRDVNDDKKKCKKSESSDVDVDKKKCKKSESRNDDVDKKKCKKSESRDVNDDDVDSDGEEIGAKDKKRVDSKSCEGEDSGEDCDDEEEEDEEEDDYDY